MGKRAFGEKSGAKQLSFGETGHPKYNGRSFINRPLLVGLTMTNLKLLLSTHNVDFLAGIDEQITKLFKFFNLVKGLRSYGQMKIRKISRLLDNKTQYK
jgi:hypothetical protein